MRRALGYADVRVLPIPPDAFPRTTSGKIRRARLRELFVAGEFAALEADVSRACAAASSGATVRPQLTRHAVEALVIDVWADVLEVPAGTIDRHDRFLTIGGSSLAAMQVLNRLEESFALTLAPTVLSDCATPAELAEHLLALPDARLGPRVPVRRQGSGDAAIIAMACRFPDAPTPEAFWGNLLDGRDSVTEIPESRWAAPSALRSRWGAFLDDVGSFDAEFFGVEDAEAALIDPHARVFLEIAHEALERAGYAGVRRTGLRIGVFVGVGESGYADTIASCRIESLLQALRPGLREVRGVVDLARASAYWGRPDRRGSGCGTAPPGALRRHGGAPPTVLPAFVRRRLVDRAADERTRNPPGLHRRSTTTAACSSEKPKQQRPWKGRSVVVGIPQATWSSRILLAQRLTASHPGDVNATRPLVLDAAAVAQRLPDVAAVATALRGAFAELAAGTAQQPTQTVLPLADGASDVIVYSGTLDGPALAGVKLSPYLAGRPPGERVTAWTLLLSTSDGRPVLLVDSGRLTVERTAGTTAVAVDALAPASSRTLAVVGSGPIGLAHLRHVGAVRSWRRIVISSPALTAGDPARLAALKAQRPDVEVAADPAAAARDADVVCLCTSAAQPVVRLSDLREDVLVTSVSTNAPGAHEVDPQELLGCAVYVDSRGAAPVVASELRSLIDSGRIEVLADLPELITRTAPPRPPGRAVFRSVGLGIEDLAIAALLLDTSEARP